MPEEDVKKLREEIAASSKGQAKDEELSIDDLNTVAGGVNFPASFTHVHIGSSFSASALSAVSPRIDFSKVQTSTVMCPW